MAERPGESHLPAKLLASMEPSDGEDTTLTSTDSSAQPSVIPSAEPSAPPLETFGQVMRWIFVGKAGLRAGWSLLIYFAMMGCSAIPLVIALHFLEPLDMKGVQTPGPTLIDESAAVLLVAVPTLFMSLIERKSMLGYGLTDPRPFRRFFVGFLWGFVAIAVLMGLLCSAGLAAFQGLALRGTPVLGYGLVWALAFLLVALFEESFFRGYIQSTLTRGIGFWWAALLLSGLFALVHIANGGENWVGLLSVFAGGMFFCLGLRLTGSLLWPIGFHAGWDWAQSYFFGVADSGMLVKGHLLSMRPTGSPLWSGGAAGPEGSPLGLLVLTLAAYVLWRAGRANSGTVNSEQ